MDSNLFERKNFLDGNWIMTNPADIFSSKIIGQYIVLTVNLIRATANEAEILRKYLTNFPKDTEKTIVVDLSKCNFVDSTFLSGIISYNKHTNSEIRLVVSDRRQLAILKITKIDSLFKIYLDIDQAMV